MPRASCARHRRRSAWANRSSCRCVATPWLSMGGGPNNRVTWDGMGWHGFPMDFHGFSWMCRCSFLGIELSGICDCHLLSRYCKLCCRECRNENKSQICGKICCHCTPANIHLFVQARPTCGGNSLQVGPVLNSLTVGSSWLNC